MGKDLTGKSLEQVVGRIQQMYDSASEVRYRERICNRLGIAREFDVVVRGHFAGHPMLGVIECKDWKDKVGTPEVDAFITKSSDINANLRLIVSSRGFTGPALKQAKDSGVGVFSLLPDDPADTGFSVGILWYARAYKWDQIQLHLRFHGQPAQPSSYKGEEVLYLGKPVVNWFLRELSTTYCHITSSGPFALNAKFDAPVSLTIQNRPYEASEITVTAERICRKKSRFMQMTGDAFFDWQTNSLSVPARGSVTVRGFRSDLSDWEDYDGEIPEIGPYQCVIDRFLACIDLETAEVPDVPSI